MQIALSDGVDEEVEAAMDALQSSIGEYAGIRIHASRLSVECMGKEVLKKVYRDFGFATSFELERRAIVIWRDGIVPEPPASVAAREFIRGISGA